MNVLHKLEDRIYHIGLRSAQLLTLLLAGGLTICSLFWGYYAEEMDTQASIPHNEPFFLHLLGALAMLLLLSLLLKFTRTHAASGTTLILAAALCWVGFWGIFLIFSGRTIPAADSASVYSIARALASDQTGVIHPTDSYLSYYPQQIGLVAFYEIIIRLWNLLPISYEAYYILQCINVGMACVIVYVQYKTTCLLFHDKAGVSYLFLAVLNAPLVIYTSFVYGEIPSFAFLSAGIYLLLVYFAKKELSFRRRLLYLICSLPMMMAAVVVRKNSLIVIIAAVIVLLWEWLRTQRHYLLFYTAVLVACCISVLPAIQRIYEHRADNTLSTGVPAISYVAMGMQESSRGNGWYNGFNFYTYQESNMDTAVTTEKSKAAIRASLSAFRENPDYAFRFYADKFLSQWTDGSYFCRQATMAHANGRRAIVDALYTGSLSLPFNHYCNIYQLLVYGSCLTCLINLWRRRRTEGSAPGLPLYICIIAVLGGFLFHMVWEANSRYILPYFLLLLPYAAQGLGIAHTALDELGKNSYYKYIP